MSGMKFDMKSLERGINRLESKSEIAMRAQAEQATKKLVSAAKENKKWKDRSGDATRRLQSRVEHRKDAIWIYLYHGVDYGIYLEFAHEKKYAVIFDTLRYVGTFDIIPGFQRLLERL